MYVFGNAAVEQRSRIARSRLGDPNPKDNSLQRAQTSTCKGFHYVFIYIYIYIFAALVSFSGVSVRVRVPLLAARMITLACRARHPGNDHHPDLSV